MTNQSASPLNAVNLLICLLALLCILLLILTSVRIVQIQRLSSHMASFFQQQSRRQPTNDHDVDQTRHGGLASAIVRSLPALQFGEGMGKGGVHSSTECAVCLGELFAGEWLRLLPKCAHMFHVSCIDTWLRSHSNCPLCRAEVLWGFSRCNLLEQGILQNQGFSRFMLDTDLDVPVPGTISPVIDSQQKEADTHKGETSAVDQNMQHISPSPEVPPETA